MNVRKTIFAVGGVGLILLMPVTRLQGEDVSSRQDPTPQKNSSQPVEKAAAKTQAAPAEKTPTAAADPAEKKQPPAAAGAAQAKPGEQFGAGDPFAYAAAGTGDYTPLSGNKNVGVITVKGIIRIDGEPPKAILYMKDTDRVHYVSKDSVVRVSIKNKNATSPSEAYIVVKDIRNDEVELIQLERPDKVIIIR